MTRWIFRLGSWSLAAAIVVLSWGDLSLRPQTGFPQTERFAAYAVLAGLFSLAYPRRPRWIAAGAVLAAIVLEVGQRFIPYRDGHARDAAVKVLGALCGVAAIGAMRWLAARRIGENSSAVDNQ